MKKVEQVIKNCFSGLAALLADPIGTLLLLCLAAVSILALRGKVSDMAVCGCFTLISGLGVLMKHRAFSGSDLDRPPLPPPGSLMSGGDQPPPAP
jgi:hypothetical protein